MYAFQHLAPKTSDEQYSYTISNIMYAAYGTVCCGHWIAPPQLTEPSPQSIRTGRSRIDHRRFMISSTLLTCVRYPSVVHCTIVLPTHAFSTLRYHSVYLRLNSSKSSPIIVGAFS